MKDSAWQNVWQICNAFQHIIHMHVHSHNQVKNTITHTITHVSLSLPLSRTRIPPPPPSPPPNTHTPSHIHLHATPPEMHEIKRAEVTDGWVVIVGISATWNVLPWSGGHEFEPWLDRTWDAWYFCPRSHWWLSSYSRHLSDMKCTVMIWRSWVWISIESNLGRVVLLS